MTPVETREIDAGGVTLRVQIAGQGPDVLLVHGFPDDSRVWRMQVPFLVAAGYRVIVPDMRGCGRSDAPVGEAAYRLPILVADLAAILDALGIGKVRLVAHDWGAAISWRFCMTHADRVTRYLALSVGHPSAYARAPIGQKIKGYYILFFQLRGLSEWLLRLGNWRLFRRMVRFDEEAPNWIGALSRPGRLTAALNYYRANFDLIFPRAWPKVTVPVTGVWSSRDIALSESQMIATEKYMAAPWRYYRVDGARHWLQLDAPDTVNRLILSFLEERNGPAEDRREQRQASA